ncbi:hypothetical protein N7454_008244 [Penicillium verhagenii]|nr:hypothetical protein N7454_008244 [Penicillium verhagenii]
MSMMDMDPPPLPPPQPTPPPPPPLRRSATDPRLANIPPRPSLNTNLPRLSSAPNPSVSTPQITPRSNPSLVRLVQTSATPGGSEDPGQQDVSVVEVDENNILVTLSKFNVSQFNVLNQQNEKKRLDEIAARSIRELERSKTMKTYPATAEMYRELKKKSENDINKLNHSLNQHQSICNKMTAEFAKNQSLLVPTAQSSVKEPTLLPLPPQTENDGKDEKIAKLEAKVQELQRVSEMFDNSIEDHSSRMSRLLRETGALTSWRVAIEGGERKLPLGCIPVDVDRDIKEAKATSNEALQRANLVTGELATMKEKLNTQNARTTPDGLEQALTRMDQVFLQIPVLQGRLENAEKIFHPIAAIESRVQGSLTEIEALKSKVDHAEATGIELNNIFRNLEKDPAGALREGTGATNSNQSTDQGSKIANARVAALETRHSVLDSNMKDLLAQGAAWTEALTSFKVALRSIEMRYDNISTENLVKRMAHAMFEMYPTLPQVTDKVQALQLELGASHQSLTDRIHKIESSTMTEAMAARAKIIVQTEIVSVRDEINKSASEVLSLRDEVRRYGPDMAQFRSRVDILDNKIASLPSVLQTEWNEASKEAIEKLVQPIRQVQGELSERISKLSESMSRNQRNVNDLHESYNSLSTAFQGLADDHSDDVKGLTDKSNQLSIESKKLAGTMNSQFDRLTDEYQTLKSSLQEIQNFTDELKILQPVEDIANIRRIFDSAEDIQRLGRLLEDKSSIKLAEQTTEMLSLVKTELEKFSNVALPHGRVLGIANNGADHDLRIRGCSTLAAAPMSIVTSPTRPQIPTETGDNEDINKEQRDKESRERRIKKKESKNKEERMRPNEVAGSDNDCQIIEIEHSSAVTGSGKPVAPSFGPSDPSSLLKKKRKKDGKRSREEIASGDDFATPTPSTGRDTPVHPSSGNFSLEGQPLMKKSKKSKKKDKH